MSDRYVGCGYCAARLYEYSSDDPPPSEHKAALKAFAAQFREARAEIIAKIREAAYRGEFVDNVMLRLANEIEEAS